MAKGLGIVALVLAILSLFSPIFVNFVAIWVAMVCAAIAIYHSEYPLPVAAIGLAFFGLLLFSPVSMGAIAIAMGNDSVRLLIFAFGGFLLPVMAVIARVNANRKSGAIE